jgi:hypothetical protein
MVAFRGNDGFNAGRGRKRASGPSDPFGRRLARPDRRATLATGGRGMPTEVIRTAPLNVLVIPADARLDVAPMLPALRPHCALLCTSPAQGVEAARHFGPDVVLIDLRVPDAAGLIGDLTRAAGRSPMFVALTPSAGPAPVPPGFRYVLALPATAGELERLLWQVGGDLTARPPAPAARPDSGMIG